MGKTVLLARRPDLVQKLEKYGVLPRLKKNGPNYGIAKQWAAEKKAPYDTAEYQALANRLPSGWEELSTKEMGDLLKRLDDAIAEKKKEELDIPNLGSEALVQNVVKIVSIGLATVATLIMKDGLGPLPDGPDNEKRKAKLFGLELIGQLIESTGALTIFFRQIGRMIPASSESQNEIGDQLKCLAMIMAILAAAGDGSDSDDNLNAMMVSFGPMLVKEIKKIEGFVDRGLANETFGLNGGDLGVKGLSLSVRQARIALEQEDFEGFKSAIFESLRLIGVSSEQFYNELKEIRSLANNLQTAMTSGMDEATKKLTTMSQAM